jgi:predicted TIM-barrel fold metal-dependent hydrolase
LTSGRPAAHNAAVAAWIDSDQHLFEPRGLWEAHIDPRLRHEAIRFVDDALGHTRLVWRDRTIAVADVQTPGETDAIGERRRREREGLAPLARYDEALPRDYFDPAARAAKLAELGFDEAVVFPNYGLVFERTLSVDLGALRANMAAWNRWCATVVAEGRGRLHPVAHLTLRGNPAWLEGELAALARAGVRLAMIAPALVDGRPLSHPDLERAWAAFVDLGVSPVFHVADQPKVFDEAWYAERSELGVSALDAVMIHVPAALACTDLILSGVLERHPDLRLGIVELSAVWVPLYLMMLDGGAAFVERLGGRPPKLAMKPSDYFRRQVRVSCFAYELPRNVERLLGGADLLMACSDYPHSEGTARPIADYAAPGRLGVRPEDAPGLFGGNAAFLLRRDA